ncbi:MAG TPA: hypothetical protein VKD72_21130, partial [Gemmataceae bacterium]|nr:hypothetical protein [Gemmataceae bacterium]
LFENLLARLKAYSPVVLLSGDVHYSASNVMSYWFKEKELDTALKPEPARFVQFTSSGMKNVMPAGFASQSFAFAQRLIRANIGAERLGWNKSSPSLLTLKPGANVSPRLRSLVRKSPVLLPTRGWGGAVNNPDELRPDWAWRVTPIRDVRADKDRPEMARPATLFPDNPTRGEDDIGEGDVDGYHRVAGRHARQADRLLNSRQVLFAPSFGIVTFQKRKEKDRQLQEVDVLYAIHDLYTVQRDPANLTDVPPPLAYTRHEAALRDFTDDAPAIPPT